MTGLQRVHALTEAKLREVRTMHASLQRQREDLDEHQRTLEALQGQLTSAQEVTPGTVPHRNMMHGLDTCNFLILSGLTQIRFSLLMVKESFMRF